MPERTLMEGAGEGTWRAGLRRAGALEKGGWVASGGEGGRDGMHWGTGLGGRLSGRVWGGQLMGGLVGEEVHGRGGGTKARLATKLGG